MVPKTFSDCFVRQPLGGDTVATPESDRDSGCCSEEHSWHSQDKTAVPIDAKYVERKEKDFFKRDSNRSNAADIYKRTNSSPRPFQRRIWKRRNGWFRVRNQVKSCNE